MFEFLSLSGAIALWALLWRGGARYFHRHGHGAIVRHLLSGTLGWVGAVLALIVAVFPDGHPGALRTALFWLANALVWWRLKRSATYRAKDSAVTSPNEPAKKRFVTSPDSDVYLESSSLVVQQSANETVRRPTPHADAIRTNRRKQTTETTKSHVLDEIKFSYRDYEGNSTTRKVRVHRVSDAHFEGFCLMRGATRTFKITNVTSQITRIETGEILSVDEWMAELEG
ncbi:MAG: hypothetical protein V4793_23070 [Paraburkholderia tropica]|uniref:hypothetical protein n=1 Tax=Paraburkholderia tropica TaxID=92647 RepID=UPI003100CFB3